MLASHSGNMAVMPQQDEPLQSSSANVDWPLLVEQVRRGDEAGMEELYGLFKRGIRYYLYRQLGVQDLDDKVHDTFLIVVQAIRKGEIRDPERLMGFVRTVTRRQVAAHINQAISKRRDEVAIEPGVFLTDRKESPEAAAIEEQKSEFVRRTLRNMSARDREILTRFYLMEQKQDQICREMGLTETQFRLLKSRAKGRFGEAGKRKIDAGESKNFFVRALSALRH